MSESLTIAIPTYRRPHYLRECLDSILESGLRPSEILVGNNGGDPETDTTLAAFGGRLPIRELKNFLTPPTSYLRNLEALIQAATGEWLCIFHDDDFFYPEAANILPLLANPSVDIVFADIWITDEQRRILEQETHSAARSVGRDLLQEGFLDPFPATLSGSTGVSGFFVRTGLARQISFCHDIGFYGDLHWVRSLGQIARRAGFLKQRIWGYRTHAQSLSSEGFNAYYEFESVRRLDRRERFLPLISGRLRVHAPRAVASLLRSGNFRAAGDILFSKDYPKPQSLNEATRIATLVLAWMLLRFVLRRSSERSFVTT